MINVQLAVENYRKVVRQRRVTAKEVMRAKNLLHSSLRIDLKRLDRYDQTNPLVQALKAGYVKCVFAVLKDYY